MVTIAKYPSCLHCGREFKPGEHWFGSNACRLLYLMELIESSPGITTHELALKSRMAYGDVSKALTKGRGLDLFGLVPEEREQGGIRYRYAVIADWRLRLQRMLVPPEKITADGKHAH